MGRFLAISAAVCLIGGFGAYQLDLLPQSWFPKTAPAANVVPKDDTQQGAIAHDPALGGALYPDKKLDPEPQAPTARLNADPILLSGHITVLDKVDVPSQ